jgi:hypothetical protein
VSSKLCGPSEHVHRHLTRAADGGSRAAQELVAAATQELVAPTQELVAPAQELVAATLPTEFGHPR